MSAPVTVIGLGAMGSTMADVFLRNGRQVTVWNRTASKAEPLVAKGAKLAESPAAALAAADLIVISQIDYQAMYDSLGDATSALRGKVLVNLSSGSPEELREACEWVRGHGAELVTGGIMVPPPGIGQPGSYTFYSGSEAAVERHRETLAELSEVTYVGSDPGLAMLFYQSMLNVMWQFFTAYFGSVALVQSAGRSAEDLRPFVAKMLVELAGDGPMGLVGVMTKEIDRGEYPGGENSLHMQAVGAGHVVETLRDAGLDATVPEAMHKLFTRAESLGHGADGLSAVIEAVKKP